MSEFKLSNSLAISLEDAKIMINKYFSNLPNLGKFLTAAASFGKKNLMIRTCKPYSRIRFFDAPNNDFKKIGEIERASKNTVIQGTGADMVKLALVNLRNYIKTNKLQNKVKIVMTVHDQIDCEVNSEFADEWSKIQKKIMEESGETIIKGIPVLSEITISDCWTK